MQISFFPARFFSIDHSPVSLFAATSLLDQDIDIPTEVKAMASQHEQEAMEMATQIEKEENEAPGEEEKSQEKESEQEGKEGEQEAKEGGEGSKEEDSEAPATPELEVQKKPAGKAKAAAKPKASPKAGMKRPAAAKSSASKKPKKEVKAEVPEPADSKTEGAEKPDKKGKGKGTGKGGAGEVAEEKDDEKEEKEVPKKSKKKDEDEKKEKKDKVSKDQKGKTAEKKEKKDKDKKEKDEKQEKKEKEKKLNKGALADQEKAAALMEIEEVSEEKDADEATPADTSGSGRVLRDSKKSWFFHRHFAELPESVQSLFNAKDLSRAQKSELVNSCVTKDASGSWSLQPNNPTVNALSSIFKKVVGGEYFVFIRHMFKFFSLVPFSKVSIFGFLFMT